MNWLHDLKRAIAFGLFPHRKTALHRRGGAKVALGNRGEALAVTFLKRAGYRVVDTNVALRFGELDVVAESPESKVVFVEVKAGRHHPRYRPEMHVNAAKRRKLVRLGRAYLKLRGWGERAHRYDVIAVVFYGDGREPEVRHHVNAIRRR